MSETDKWIGLLGLSGMALMAGMLIGGTIAESKVTDNIHSENIKYMEETGKCPYELRDVKKVEILINEPQ